MQKIIKSCSVLVYCICHNKIFIGLEHPFYRFTSYQHASEWHVKNDLILLEIFVEIYGYLKRIFVYLGTSPFYKTDILKLVSIRVLKHLEMNVLCFERHLICFVISLKGIKIKSRNLDILSPIPE